MLFIQKNEDLQTLCAELAEKPYFAIDTEFIRERTFWPELCLVQIAADGVEACIDALAGLDMSCFYDILNNKDIVKVFHSCRQDLEIFYVLSGKVPCNVFDTQVAGMVCGMEEMASYQKLVSTMLGVTLDKGQRFTDWAKRPLTDKQIKYALCDVTYLLQAYKIMIKQMTENGRLSWIKSDMEALCDEKLYEVNPDNAWKKVRTHIKDKKSLGVLKEIAKWRELEAMHVNLPRKQVLKDEVLLEIASCQPTSKEELAGMRGLPRRFAKNRLAEPLLQAVQRGLENPAQLEEESPLENNNHHSHNSKNPQFLSEILGLLLDIKATEAKVAGHLIASANDLDEIARYSDNAKTKTLSGWRYDIFGRSALALCHGDISLSYNPDSHTVIINE